jgi:hypothetical protein
MRYSPRSLVAAPVRALARLTVAVWLPLLMTGCSNDSSPPSAPIAPATPNAVARATATTTSHVRFKDLGADATFRRSDATFCIETEVVVLGGERTAKELPGKPQTGPLAIVQVSQFDFCTGELLRAIFASAEDATFQAEPAKLTAASLQATIPGFDFVHDTDVQVEVDLAWTGTGELGSVASTFRSKQPGSFINQQFKGTVRPAAASGTVTVEGENLIPNTAESAEIFRTKFGQLDIVRTR